MLDISIVNGRKALAVLILPELEEESIFFSERLVGGIGFMRLLSIGGGDEEL